MMKQFCHCRHVSTVRQVYARVNGYFWLKNRTEILCKYKNFIVLK